MTEATRILLDVIRREHMRLGTPIPTLQDIMDRVAIQLTEADAPSLRPVINLTGTVLHTNLGRAPLPRQAIDAMVRVAAEPSNLEFDLATGSRGDRDDHIASLLVELTGCEAATVVNNNAAAVFLVLNTLAHGRQVPVSRGELVEIGGSFRIPEIMARAGCELVEVGATNRTHLYDYANAISARTALLMKVHTSNFEIRGFTKSVSEADLARLAHERSLPMVTDLGSGTLIDLTRLGLPAEPRVQSALDHGADLVTFSGDKLLGGPQAGLIVGRKALIDQIKSNPVKRALRPDKLTIAGLFEVLKLYRDPDTLARQLPALRLLTRSPDDILQTAQALLPALARCLDSIADVEITPSHSQIGSGSLPMDTLAGYALAIMPHDRSDARLQQISEALRRLPVPVIGRINDGRLLLDLRTLEDPRQLIDQLPGMEIP